jgi:tryptophan synthase alpha chain
MSRLRTVAAATRERGRKALVPFCTGGYPDRETFVKLLLEAQASGADAVEVGIPFSDPSADGPVIQRASEAALSGGTTTHKIFDDVSDARARGLHIPLVFMTYYNPVLSFGPEAFARGAREAGADGVIVVDLPPEEAEEFAPTARRNGLDTVFLVAPTTPAHRVPTVLRECSGFVYCVSVTGVTGDKRPLADAVREIVDRIRRHSDLPVLVGFGVTGSETARAMARVSDGVIVGSALLRAVEGLRGERAVDAAGSFLRGLRKALDDTAT